MPVCGEAEEADRVVDVQYSEFQFRDCWLFERTLQKELLFSLKCGMEEKLISLVSGVRRNGEAH